VLNVVPDQGDGFYRLYWTGGNPPYDVYRSTDPALIVTSANRLGETVGNAWIDQPPAAGVHYYMVTSSCAPACAAGEICCNEACCGLPHATPACGGGTLTCVVESCDPGYWNVNGLSADGCEFFCDTPSMTDFPDPQGLDENCDFVDGEVANSIFVARSGSDVNAGTMASPKLTIQAGIDAAVAGGRRDVYVAAGLYFEEIVLPGGVGVYGGYTGDFRARNVATNETIIFGTQSTVARPGAVNVFSILNQPAGSSVLDGFTVFAPDGGASGASSYGVYVHDTDASLRLGHNRVYGGYGADGATGGDGTTGQAGPNGSTGVAALDLNVAFGVVNHGCLLAHERPGGPGGSRTCSGQSTNGGNGGTSACPAFTGGQTLPPVPRETGTNGFNGGGPGGPAGWDVYQLGTACSVYQGFGDLIGSSGSAGLQGNSGTAGAGCSQPAGSVVSGLWAAAPSGAGANGADGGGGGGGGSGAGAWMDLACVPLGYGSDNLGGSGGGGGAGGCGGRGGTGAGGGGGSFAIFVVFGSLPASVPAISGNSLYTGIGGTGGIGGAGVAGGSGGGGGAGGAGMTTTTNPAWPSFRGGDGGQGGSGGSGGGGGGGCGGPTYGLFAWNTGGLGLAQWAADNTFILNGAGGAGGAGGPALVNRGGNGADGPHAAKNF
jgi:hypothetical protein